MHRLFSILLAAVTALFALHCAGSSSAETDLHARAERLAHESLLIDGHIDLPMRMHERWEDISVRTRTGDFDYVRARQGGLDAPFMAVYIPPEEEPRGTAKPLADSLIEVVRRMAATWPDKFAVAVSTREVRDQFRRGLMSLIMGMENGAPIGGDLKNVRYFHGRGIRYITLCHGKDNHICDSSYDTTRTWKGLSPFGKTLVPEMNRVGIMVDVSHISDDSFFDVMKITTSPVIASHSSCRAFTPGFERNMSDEMIRLLGANGGIIMINFGSEFLDKSFQQWEERRQAITRTYLKEHGGTRRDSAAWAYVNTWKAANPPPYAPIERVADHIDHVVKLIGIDHVGLGSDYEGLGDMLPVGLKDVSGYPNLIAELLRRGYSDDEIRKICGENLMRVWGEVERRAYIE